MNGSSERKLLVIDDDADMRSGLRYILGEGFKIVGAASGEEGIECASGDTYPVVILDLVMDGMSGMEVLKQLKKINNSQRVIILTGKSSQDTAIAAVNMGAFKYILKPVGVEDLKGCVMEGFDSYEREARAFAPQAESLQSFGLTKREEAIAIQVKNGETNAEIASAFGISRRTVEKHLEAIYLKLGVSSRTKLARLIQGA